jgi:S1-C subfamily serine protease
MAFDDPSGEADDRSTSGPPLHPDDRLWRHPSEVGGAMRGAALAAEVSRAPKRSRSAVLAVGLTSGIIASVMTVGALTLVGAFDRTAAVPTRSYTSAIGANRGFEVATTPASLSTLSTDPSTMARRVEPGLARVEVTTKSGRLTGTAVAVRADGFFLTSAELLQNDDVWLTTADGNRSRATVIGVDRVTNLGVLRSESDKVTVATWGTSGGMVAGADALIVSAADSNARSPSVARGLISATGVRYTLDDGTVLHDLVRTDANLVPAAVGGVMLDRDGAVIGIVTTIGKDPAGAARTGYAMPIEYAKALAESYIVFGHPAPVWLGVVGTTLSKEQADSLGITGGVMIDSVTPQSPAQIANLQPGDVIVAIDNKPVDTWSTMNLALRSLDPGDALNITFRRGVDTVQQLTFVARPPQTYRDQPSQ